jgi:hypothetical protein
VAAYYNFLKFPNSEIGHMIATNGLVIAIVQLPLTGLWQKMKILVLPMILASAFAAIAYTIVIFARTFLQFEIVMIIVTFGEIFQSVPSQTAIAFFSKSGNKGSYQGYYNAATNTERSIASFVGPASFGLLVSEVYVAWIIVAVFSVIIGLGFFFLYPLFQSDYKKNKETWAEK